MKKPTPNPEFEQAEYEVSNAIPEIIDFLELRFRKKDLDELTRLIQLRDFDGARKLAVHSTF